MIKRIKQKFTFFGMVTPTKHASRQVRLWSLSLVVLLYIGAAIVTIYMVLL